ncbi:hypothetical protein [Niastella populi]|uniref:SMP-30/Gluconolactonase/LRE-like region domain-containing protein n=1 Tax=Niastella populi TaxID=550983 RepID=A0A1V9GCP0_9BACT|nr:hypothetical protein [Niastella populi]OQP68322.1 hypothetical protein A4R26_00500 [Niastella populi]
MRNKLMVLLLLLYSVNSFTQDQPGTFTNLGPQLGASMIQGSIFLKDSKGRALVYTVVRGEPAHLLAYDVATGELLLDAPLEGADGAWDLAVATDGTLYIPGASGFLFSHKPGTGEVKNLGQALPGQTYVWNLVSGKAGEVFGATYPGCRVFRYHPKQGFSDAGKGPLVEGENYVRSLAYDAKTGLLYAGVGSHAHLLEMDPVTGQKKELLPEKYRDKDFVYGLELAPGKKGHDRLLALLTTGNTTLVYNLHTKQVEQEIEGMDMKAVLTDKKTQTVFYTSGKRLMQFNASKPAATANQLAAGVGTANAFAFGAKNILYMLTSGADLVKYHLSTGVIEKMKLHIPPQPIPINALLYGPDEKIWMGGYLAGGHATYDPRTGVNTKYTGLDQTEGMTVSGSKIFFGIYPGGRFYMYDTKRHWNVAENNPVLIGEAEGQSRAFAVLKIHTATEQEIFFGTVPEYGKLGGALVVYNEKNNKFTVFDQPVAQQSVVSLVQNEATVLGGTSISGGLGIKPSTKEAVLFGWDIARNEKIFELVPVPGAAAITCLIKGPDNHIWGVADGTLFIFDADKRAVISTNKLYDYPPFNSHIWRSAAMAIHPSGMVYGTGNNNLFTIDPQTRAVTILNTKASLFAMDKEGTIYFRRSVELWKYRP